VTTQTDQIENKILEHSFVIPVYGDSSFLDECIKSLLSQTKKSKILITTATPSKYITTIADKYKIPVVTNKQASGIASDWNFAIKSCKTKYCTLAHQDDIYLPEYTEKMLRAIKKNTENLIVFCDYAELKNDSSKFWITYLIIKRVLLSPFYFKRSWQNNFVKKTILSLGCPICCPSVIFNLDMLQDFQFNSKFTINLDWDAWLKLSKKEGGFCFVPKPLMQHRISSECETSIGLKENRRQNEDKIIFQRLWPKYIASLLGKFYEFCYCGSTERNN